MKLIPKNWGEFQHYKDRSPPWIKLHKKILDDRAFMSLPLASKALAPMLWLLASEDKNGVFDASVDELTFRLRITQSEVEQGLKPLIDKGFFLDASTMLAPCFQVAVPETETETETDIAPATECEKPNITKTDLKKACPDIDPSLIDQWFAVRKDKKASTLTKRAWDKFVTEAAKAEITIQRALEICVDNHWRGFESSWLKSNPMDHRGQSQPPQMRVIKPFGADQ